MSALPEKFVERMTRRLPAQEREAFFAVYEKPPYKGLRVNTLKISAEEFLSVSPFALRPVPWAEDGFYTDAEKPGAHPYHFAGLYYSQEPSAMCAAPLLRAEPGERVLDLCAAPGGKGTQLASAMRGEGILVLNEPVSARARILSGNVERMGVRNAVVLNETPVRLAAFFGGYFDKILVDAPCSGEGMFRKNPEEAVGEWSEENVKMCAARQAEILREAAVMLKPGGRLVYSTCTFSEEEDEGQVSDYLQKHPEFRLLESRKLLPHKAEGEGHFAALFEKTGEDAQNSSAPVRSLRPRVSREGERAYRAFESEFLHFRAENLHEAGGLLYALPDGVFDWKDLRVLRAGIRLGELRNGRFEPSHSLAMCLAEPEFARCLRLDPQDPLLSRFLHGEEIAGDGKGWTAVCAGRFPVGWGKISGGTVKNHIPKGLRMGG